MAEVRDYLLLLLAVCIAKDVDLMFTLTLACVYLLTKIECPQIVARYEDTGNISYMTVY